MAPFRVIIVGGSIAGLALANMLEQYGIDFLVLEKHPEIAPQVGAGFAIQPNGARILDQLGCYQELEDANEPVNTLTSFDEYSTSSRSKHDFGKWFEESFGYKMRFMDRRKIIETLYENLRDKSKVKTSCGVVKILTCSGRVEVETEDGSTIYGDLIVGADGVHSRIRQEMQRIAAEDTPSADLFPESKAFTSEYSGVFGISKAPDGTISDEGFKCFRKGRNYLCAAGPNGTLYWILMFKNKEKLQGTAIRRYTEQDLDRLLDLARDDIVKPGISFGDIFDRRIRASIVPIEEGILEQCFYKRVVLLGDSWHKVNPLGGLGGNTAIQSAAILANGLKDVTMSDGDSHEAGINAALRNYQRDRKSLSRVAVDLSHTIQKAEALETPVAKFIQLNIIKYASMETMANSLGKLFAPTPRLKYLDPPSRRGLMPFSDEVQIKPKDRSRISTALFAILVAALFVWFYPSTHPGDEILSTKTKSYVAKVLNLDQAQSVQLYYNLSIMVITGIISVESYRRCFFIHLLGSALPFGIAAMFVGWGLVAPIYMILFVFSTGARAYYYPGPRAIDLSVARALQPAFLINYLPIIAYTFASSTFPSFLWALSHATLPLTIGFVAKWIARRSTTSLRGPAILWGSQDLKSISGLFQILRIILFLEFLFGEARVGLSALKLADSHPLFFSGASSYSSEDVKAALLDVIMMGFMYFTMWDLQRVKANAESLGTMIFNGTGAAIAFGPAVAVARLWETREAQWEASRQRDDQKTLKENTVKKA